MGDDRRHVFRFFADVVGAPGARVELDPFDAHHARVLHGSHAGEAFELVDAANVAWSASFDGPAGILTLGERLGEVRREPRIELVALVTVGGRTDDLVDGAVQAGATRIVPVVRSARDRAKVDQRHDRLARIAQSAAKQSKRAAVPAILAAMHVDELSQLEPGIVVDPAADEPLDAVVRNAHARAAGAAPVRLLVGSADGFPPGLVDQLAAAGWQRARLGETILRSELAAATAVAIAAMLAPQT